jgi:hypothetical protein
MFYTIHRCIKVVAYCAALFVVWKLYEQREVFEPAVIWYDVWDNGGLRAPEPRRIAGRVLHVINSQTFVLSTRASGRFNVRLMGLKPPSTEMTVDSIERERTRRDALEKMIGEKWVHVEIAYENLNNLGGLVFLGPTNVNADLVLRRLATSNKETVKGLSRESQYALLWALRRREPTH